VSAQEAEHTVRFDVCGVERERLPGGLFGLLRLVMAHVEGGDLRAEVGRSRRGGRGPLEGCQRALDVPAALELPRQQELVVRVDRRLRTRGQGPGQRE
jgi:hypothetical protein